MSRTCAGGPSIRARSEQVSNSHALRSISFWFSVTQAAQRAEGNTATATAKPLKHFDSYSFAYSLVFLLLQWLITNEAIKWLLTKCLSALACQMCQNSRVRLKLFACHSSDLYVSAACAGLFPYAYNASHSQSQSHSNSDDSFSPLPCTCVCHTCHLCFYNSFVS